MNGMADAWGSTSVVALPETKKALKPVEPPTNGVSQPVG